MERYETMIRLIYEAIDEVNATVRPEQVLDKSGDTVLVGDRANLESLNFVKLIVAIEENIARVFTKEVCLVDIMFSEENPEWTVAKLARRVAQLIEVVPHTRNLADSIPVAEF